jgi:hypothetical protein
MKATGKMNYREKVMRKLPEDVRLVVEPFYERIVRKK